MHNIWCIIEKTLIIIEISVDELRSICFPVIIETNQTLKERNKMKTTNETIKQATSLSIMLFGEVTASCRHYIDLGEEECSFYIKRICAEFNVMP